MIPIKSCFRILAYIFGCWLVAGCATTSDGELQLPDLASPDVEKPEGAGDISRSASGGPSTQNTEKSDDVCECEGGEESDSAGILTDRMRREREDAFNPYVLTVHKHNYVLPVTYSSSINEDVYQENDIPIKDGLQQAEVKFQISLKSQLNEKDLLLKNDALFLGITLEAWWQLYSSDYSSPFRETNYQPELFYIKPMLWGPFGGSTAVVLGLEHQSNGKVQGLSRSWNRLYTALVYEQGNLVTYIKPWYRLPEKKKKNPDDPEGDDNPDILDFMGHGELAAIWRNGRMEHAVKLRGNTATGKGAIEISATFPLFGKFRGFVQYFNGYGDALVDYDHFQQRLGFGIALSPLF
ncbi:MAG: phospholipase A [Granulosicoccus sp.]